MYVCNFSHFEHSLFRVIVLYLNEIKLFCPSSRDFNVLLLFSTYVLVLYFTDILTHLVIFNLIN